MNGQPYQLHPSDPRNTASLDDLRIHLARENRRYPESLQLQPRAEWPPEVKAQAGLLKVFRSRDFFAFVYAVPTPGILRLTVAHTALRDDKNWEDNITWDELQALKRQAGFADYDAIEVYPRDHDVVNVANMRHLWIFQQSPLAFIWRNREAPPVKLILPAGFQA